MNLYKLVTTLVENYFRIDKYFLKEFIKPIEMFASSSIDREKEGKKRDKHNK